MAFAIQTTRKRKHIQNTFKPENNSAPLHEIYEQFLRKFGMDKPLDFAPIKLPEQKNPDLVAVCIGDENSIPTSTWETILEETAKFLPHAKFAVFHSQKSAQTEAEISNIFADKIIHSYNIKTELAIAASAIAKCNSAFGNDETSLKLANLLGIQTLQLQSNAKFIFKATNVTIKADIQSDKAAAQFAQTAATELSLLG